MHLQRTFRALLVAALGLSLAGCALTDAARAGTFSVAIGGSEPFDPVEVRVLDDTGTVTAVTVGESRFEEGVVADPADPSVLVVTWGGGMCDVRTTLTLDTTLDSMRISKVTDVRPGACRMALVMRSIAIRFDPPLDPGFVELVGA